MIIYQKDDDLIVFNGIKLCKMFNMGEVEICNDIVKYVNIDKCVSINTKDKVMFVYTNDKIYKFLLKDYCIITSLDIEKIFTEMRVNKDILVNRFILENGICFETSVNEKSDECLMYHIKCNNYEYIEINNNIRFYNKNGVTYLEMFCRSGQKFFHPIDVKNVRFEQIKELVTICGKYDVFQTYEKIKLLGILSNKVFLGSDVHFSVDAGIFFCKDRKFLLNATDEKIFVISQDYCILPIAFHCSFNCTFLICNNEYKLVRNKEHLTHSNLIKLVE